MSLEIYAKHLAEKGRGPDDTLVHMSRNEVKSLNDLAMAHGGHLTINPETGLPEASFLSALLPTIAGAALTGLSGGAINPLTAGMIVGGGTMLMGGSLQKGLMAGLGAYGGGGLGQGLADLGVSSESGLTGGATGGANVPNATTLENAKLAEQAKLAQASKYTTPDFLDVGGTGSNYLPTGSGGLNVTAPGGNIGADFEQMPGNMVQNNLVSNPLTGSQLPTHGISEGLSNMYQGAKSLITDPTADKFKALGGGSYSGLAQMGLAAASPALGQQAKFNPPATTNQKQQMVPHYRFNPGMVTPTPGASATGVENNYFQPTYTAVSDAEAAKLYPGYPAAQAAGGGLMGYAGGGPVERMSNDATLGQNTMYPMANMTTSAFATPYQDPKSTNMLAPTIAPSGGGTVNMMSGEPNMQGTRLATGGLSDAHYNLGGYSDGGRLLRGPGDGVSDSIPATIGHKQPARLADGEFVVPARIVSELGNGSTEAGARRLYAMMDRIQSARSKTMGKGKVAKNTRADKYLPA
jgi:hypothetical protein